MLLVALWQHVRLTQTLSRILLIVVFAGLLTSTIYQNIRQVYRNVIWNRHGGHVVRVSSVRQCGDSLIVKIRLKRPWKVQPGDFVRTVVGRRRREGYMTVSCILVGRFWEGGGFSMYKLRTSPLLIGNMIIGISPT